MNRISSDCIDIHNHIVPERFPAYAGKGRDVPWPSMVDAHACHKHVMISGKLYRTVADGSWSVPRRIEAMGEMRVSRQALSPMPELLSYWLPLEDSKVMIRYLNEQIAGMIAGLSPQKDWDMNVSLAKRVTEINHTHQDTVTTPEMLQKGRDIVTNTGGNAKLGDLLGSIANKKYGQLTDPLPQRADRGDDRARSGSLHRPGGGAAARCGQCNC